MSPSFHLIPPAESPWHLVVCADGRFAVGAWVTIWSACRATTERRLNCHLVTCEPEAPSIRRMQALAATVGIALHVVPVRAESLAGLNDTPRLPVSAYLRLLVPEILPGLDRCVYLDADVLVVESLGSLFERPFEGCAVAAARDYFYQTVAAGCGVGGPGAYLNSGVMVIDAAVWRHQDVTRRTLAYLAQPAQPLRHGDQDALNVVLGGNFEELAPDWNVQIGAIEYWKARGWPADRAALAAQADALLAKPRIAHFVGAAKPWNDGLRQPHGAAYRAVLMASGWVPWVARPAWKIGWFLQAAANAFRRRRV